MRDPSGLPVEINNLSSNRIGVFMKSGEDGRERRQVSLALPD
jgi:hypothetical protein